MNLTRGPEACTSLALRRPQTATVNCIGRSGHRSRVRGELRMQSSTILRTPVPSEEKCIKNLHRKTDLSGMEFNTNEGIRRELDTRQTLTGQHLRWKAADNHGFSRILNTAAALCAKCQRYARGAKPMISPGKRRKHRHNPRKGCAGACRCSRLKRAGATGYLPRTPSHRAARWSGPGLVPHRCRRTVLRRAPQGGGHSPAPSGAVLRRYGSR